VQGLVVICECLFRKEPKSAEKRRKAQKSAEKRRKAQKSAEKRRKAQKSAEKSRQDCAVQLLLVGLLARRLCKQRALRMWVEYGYSLPDGSRALKKRRDSASLGRLWRHAPSFFKILLKFITEALPDFFEQLCR
jgi:hypothetical protein